MLEPRRPSARTMRQYIGDPVALHIHANGSSRTYVGKLSDVSGYDVVLDQMRELNPQGFLGELLYGAALQSFYEKHPDARTLAAGPQVKVYAKKQEQPPSKIEVTAIAS